MRFLFRPPAADAAGLLSLPWDQPLENWDPSLLLEIPQRGISRHVVRFVASGGQVFALKEINERLARHEYALLAEFEGDGLPTVSVLGICIDRPDHQDAILVPRYLEYSMSYRWLFSSSRPRTWSTPRRWSGTRSSLRGSGRTTSTWPARVWARNCWTCGSARSCPTTSIRSRWPTACRGGTRCCGTR
jgi:hypothetical protein